MPLPGDLTTITLTGDLSVIDGSPQDGFVVIDPGQPITDETGRVIFEGAATRQVRASVMVPIVLPCNDNANLSPAGFTYQITEHLGGQPVTYSVSLPSTLGASADLSELRPAAPAPAATAFGTANAWTGTQTFAGNPPMVVPGGSAGEVLTLDAQGHVTPQAPTGGGSGAVSSVNTKTGNVVLSASDVGADPAGSASTVQGASLAKAQNLADLPSASTARASLGLGTAATHAAGDFDAAGTAASAVAAEASRAEAAEAGAAQKSANLSDLASASTARTNLGLGTAATHAASDFDTAGAASSAQSAAQSFATSAVSTAIAGLGSAAQQPASAFDAAGTASGLVATETSRAQAAEALALPQSQTLTLGHSQYSTPWQILPAGGDDTIPAPFGLTMGVQQYGAGTAQQPKTWGPALWMGINPEWIAQKAASSHYGALAISQFFEAGDTNTTGTTGLYGKGLEWNVGFLTPSFDGTGTAVTPKVTNAFQVVAANDTANYVNTTIRCGNGSHALNAATHSTLRFTNADESVVFAIMDGVTGAVQFNSAMTVYGAAMNVIGASGAMVSAYSALAGSQKMTFSAAGTGNGSMVAVTSAAGTAQLNLDGNNASTVHAYLNFRKNGTDKWYISYIEPNLYLVDEVNGRLPVTFAPGASAVAAKATFDSQVAVHSSLVVGPGAALATTATDGFAYLPSCAGVPTGTPTAQAGSVPLVIDSADGKLYAYVGGAWKGAALS